jgi:hypothetical protein
VVLLLFLNSDKVRVRVYRLGAYLNSVGFEELLGGGGGDRREGSGGGTVGWVLGGKAASGSWRLGTARAGWGAGRGGYGRAWSEMKKTMRR